MRPADIEELFARLEADDPAPGIDLEHSDPYTLLVAVVLAARATDVSVNKATRALFETAGTPDKMAALGEDGLMERIKTISLYKGKARNVIALSRILLEEHGGQVPRSREALEALPGVGRKTASVVLATAFGEPAIAVDTHVLRVANRTGLAPGAKPPDVEKALEAAVPDKWKSRAAAWLVLHGRYVCKARKPDCPACRLRDLCAYEDKTPG
jgi:endonuclease-3